MSQLLPTPNFGQALTRPKALAPETSHWYWHPNCVYAGGPPVWFREQLDRFDPELRVTWNPVAERWLVWMPKPNLARTGGWMLLFIVQYPSGEFMPLDDRVFARLYSASQAKWGSGKRYFDAYEREYNRDQEKKREESRQETRDMTDPFYDYSQIKVSGFGKSNGSKFSTYHA